MAQETIRCAACKMVQHVTDRRRCRKCGTPFDALAPVVAPPAVEETPQKFGPIIAQRIRFFRHLHGMTQRQVSAATGIARTKVSLYESGAHEPTFDGRLRDIAQVFGVSRMAMIDANDFLIALIVFYWRKCAPEKREALEKQTLQFLAEATTVNTA
jgi:DNA-binding XRE family transcriptional regulator